jgi:cyanoexosortase A
MTPTPVATLRARVQRLWERIPEPQRRWLAAQIPPIPPATPRNLWLLLAAAVATQNVAVFTSSQNAHVGVFALLVWGGALICMEDQLETLEPRPGRLGLVVGSVLVLWIVARTSSILFWEGILYLMTPLAGLALALLCLPLREMAKLRETLVCLWMVPLFALISLRLPEEPLSLLTARISGFWISLLGLPVTTQGRTVLLPDGGVTVLGACNGMDMIAQTICVCVIFLMAFPIRSRLSRFLVLAFSPVAGLLANTIRISVLALITTAGQTKGDTWFEFFHKDMGSLIFSGMAVFVFGMVYMWLLERELPPLPGEAP